MSISPEEKFIRNLWEILQAIRTTSLIATKGKPIYYGFGSFEGVGIISKSSKMGIIEKLEEWKCLDVLRGQNGEPYGGNNGRYINLRQPNFNTMYVSTKKRVSTMQNSKHKIVDKSVDLSKTSSKSYIESVSNEIDQCASYKEEMAVISKMLQVVGPTSQSIEFTIPSETAKNDPDRVGVDNLSILQDFETKYKIIANLTPPISKDLKDWNGNIRADIDYARLIQRAEKLHDDVESWKGEVFGIEKQKKQILELLRAHIGDKQQDEYTYSERILGSYQPTFDKLPLGKSLASPDINRPDIKYRFMRVMRELEKDGIITIIRVDFNFSAKPEATAESLQLSSRSLGTRSLRFYPPKHCSVTFRMNRSEVCQILPLPKNVEWDKEKGALKFRDGKSLEFEDNKSSSFRYFRLLINNHGCEVKHNDAISELGVDNKEKIENIVKTLRKKIDIAQLANTVLIKSKKHGGYCLTIM